MGDYVHVKSNGTKEGRTSSCRKAKKQENGSLCKNQVYFKINCPIACDTCGEVFTTESPTAAPTLPVTASPPPTPGPTAYPTESPTSTPSMEPTPTCHDGTGKFTWNPKKSPARCVRASRAEASLPGSLNKYCKWKTFHENCPVTCGTCD